MRIHVLPLLLGFVLLGALSHEGVDRIKGLGASAAAPAPVQQADALRQLRALSDGAGAADMGMDAAHAGGIAPLPAFVPEQDDESCASGAVVRGGSQICVWAI